MPPRPRRRARRIVRDVDALTFAAGWRLTQTWVALPVDGLHVDVIRPDDLLALSCTFTNCDLRAGGARPPTVEPREGAEAALIVEHTFQHAAEEATFEWTGVDVVEAPRDPDDGPQRVGGDHGRQEPVQWGGVGFVPARKSRVVFDLTGTTVEFSTAGILDAMTRLPLVLADLAKPGEDAPTRGTRGTPPLPVLPPIIIHLGDGLVAEISRTGPVIKNATRELLRTHPAPNASTVAGALQLARNREAFRVQTEGLTPVVARGTRFQGASPYKPGEGLTVFAPVLPEIIGRFRRNKLSSPPTAGQTAIEAPYRLQISPTQEARFAHAVDPVRATDEPGHVELWHSRLANEPTAEGGPPNEANRKRRVVRALWARDREWAGDAWKTKDDEFDPGYPLSHPTDPTQVAPGFLTSLDRMDRHMIVRQTSESWIGLTKPIPPHAVAAEALWLSSLGAWLDLHGAWDTKEYSKAEIQSILSWDHVAPMGRDQYVRVVYPGYLFPFGHQAALVKVTERKIKSATRPYAALYQRMFLVIGERTRSYGQHDLPFSRVDIRPLVSPNLDFPGGDISTRFWPKVGGKEFDFTLEVLDKDSQTLRFRTPLLWVNEAYPNLADIKSTYDGKAFRILDATGQNIAFVAKQGDKPDSRLETERIWLTGTAQQGGDSIPEMVGATVRLPAVQRLSPIGAVAIAFRDEYVAAGKLDGPGVGDVWARVLDGVGYDPNGPDPNADPTSPAAAVSFGEGGAGSDKSGGFFSPDLPVRAISAVTGPVGDIDSAVTGAFDPEKFLEGAMPKLFGLIDLVELLDPNGGTLPALVTDTLGKVASFVKDVERLVALVADAKGEADKLLQRAQQKTAELVQQAQDARAAAVDAAAAVQDLMDQAERLLTDTATDPLDLAQDVVAKVPAAVAKVDALAPQLPPLIRTELSKYSALVKAAAGTVADLAQAVDALRSLAEKQELEFRFAWSPRLQNWPADFPVFTLVDPDADNLVLSVEGRVSARGDADVTILAELRDFALTLFGEEPLMRVPFDHLSFKSGTSGKTEVDVVLGDIEFLGLLSFVETIKDLIPLDGFSDPPYMEVDAQGAKAGFTLALPSVAIGVFNLSNMSLGADVSVPFIGKAVTVGFNFCTRERPFTLTVMCLGGGGWFLIRVAPDGLDVLEVGLEATACLALDFGVASGSISAAIGLYIRLEGEAGSLTGYFRLRGEVDVLGLISASIELYMELRYQFDTGKMVGRATITVEIEVLFFSGSVQITAERQFAGSNGDPSFREVLGAQGGTSPYWTEYAAAFAAEEA